jgi:hypothetical protein
MIIGAIAFTALTVLSGPGLGVIGFVATSLCVGVKTLDRLSESHINIIITGYLIDKKGKEVIKKGTRLVEDFLDFFAGIDTKVLNKIEKERQQEDKKDKDRILLDLYLEMKFLTSM